MKIVRFSKGLIVFETAEVDESGMKYRYVTFLITRIINTGNKTHEGYKERARCRNVTQMHNWTREIMRFN